MAPLPWLPTSVLDTTSDWSWQNTVSSALGSLKDAGEELMKPIGQHIADAMPHATRYPSASLGVNSSGQATPPPFQTPEDVGAADGRATQWKLPEIQPFALPDVSAWGFGSAAAPAAPSHPPADQGFDLRPATTPMATATRQQPASPSGGFSLPGPEAWGMGSTAPPSSRAAVPAPQGVPSAGPAPSDVNGYLKYAAAKAGIDPAQVLAVMGKEGPTGWTSVGRFDTGQSFGPLQLHYAGGSNPKEGMGDRFTRATGIDLRTDSSIQAHQAAVDFAMQDLAKDGDWHQWYGADNAFPAASGGQGRFTKVNRVAPTQPAAAPGPAAGQPRASAALDVDGITKAYAGVPYTFGGPGGRGQGLGATTDCSGFVSAVWKSQYGLDLPAHTDAAYNALKQQGAVELSQADARPGDVVFYMGAGTGGQVTHHMGVYAGGGQVLDMSTSGGSGVRPRAVGHGGQFVILRDPRLSAETPKSAAAPPPIVPTGVAERTGGQKLPQPQIDALSNRPVAADAPADAAPTPIATPVRDDWRTAGASVVHPNVARAFEAANGRPPTPEETAELASLGFG